MPYSKQNRRHWTMTLISSLRNPILIKITGKRRSVSVWRVKLWKQNAKSWLPKRQNQRRRTKVSQVDSLGG
jgi:hypothetical protein